jgi:MoxR-like ATPase
MASPESPGSPIKTEAVETVIADLTQLGETLAQSFLGQAETVDLLLLALLARGHVLLESPPGLGKTTLVKSLASALGLQFGRVQFTPDLMPADLLGLRMFEEDGRGQHRFVLHKGPIFTQVLLADEINRATPRTQAALLEAMQERQVTLHDASLPLDPGFFVVATQNPLEMEGTYPLPEAQLDRFIAKLLLPSPSQEELEAILSSTAESELRLPAACLDAARLERARKLCAQVPIERRLISLAARLVRATDPAADHAGPLARSCLRYGASPRGGQALVRLAKARALSQGQLHVRSADLAAVAPAALRHRLVLNYEGEAQGVSPDDVVREALSGLNLK